jgi:hypothetical protein
LGHLLSGHLGHTLDVQSGREGQSTVYKPVL